MSDGVTTIKECSLYECYNQRKENSKFCIFHQRIKTGDK